MRNVNLYIAVQTHRTLSSRACVKNICRAIRKLPSDLVPYQYGASEDARQLFEIDMAEEQLAELYQAKGGCLNLWLRHPFVGQMQFTTLCGPRVPYNGVKVLLDYTSVRHCLGEIEEFILCMVEACEAAYACATLSGGNPRAVYVDDPRKNIGDFDGIEVPFWNPSGLHCVPGICWINVFGPEYVEFFEEETLASLSVYRSFFLPNMRGFWLQPSERPEGLLGQSGRVLIDEIKSRLGRPRAFYGYDKSTPSFQTVYDSPAFDFSTIQTINRNI